MTSIVNIVSITSTGSENKSSPTNSAFYCFLVAAIFIAFDTVAFIAMSKTKFYKVRTKYYSKKIDYKIICFYLLLSNCQYN